MSTHMSSRPVGLCHSNSSDVEKTFKNDADIAWRAADSLTDGRHQFFPRERSALVIANVFVLGACM